jgi:hypothetical protein
MKREFGKPLIEQYLSNAVDLTHVVDTASLNIGGHGTATVILFGRNRQPIGKTVRTALGLRGDTAARTDPAQSAGWISILELLDSAGSENTYLSVVDLARHRLSRHPWSLRGGGADDLMILLEAAPARLAGMIIGTPGFMSICGYDEAGIAPTGSFSRAGLEPQTIRTLVRGEDIRDWSINPTQETFFPTRTTVRSCFLVVFLVRPRAIGL